MDLRLFAWKENKSHIPTVPGGLINGAESHGRICKHSPSKQVVFHIIFN